MNKESLQKLEEFLISGCEKAIAQGMTIVDGAYHPTDDRCDPIYAACIEDREKAKDLLDKPIPYYEQIISDHIGEEFKTFDLVSFLEGYDNRDTYRLDRDIDIFNLGQRLRAKYIKTAMVLVPKSDPPPEVCCLTSEELIKYGLSREMPSTMFSHINWCLSCRNRLETVCGMKKPEIIPPEMKVEMHEWEAVQKLLAKQTISTMLIRSWQFIKNLFSFRR